MTIIIKRPVKRLFTFGCSFTEYYWPTWTEIISLDLDIPCYNYGRSGAGNQYIANTVVQADKFYNFNKDDLIIVSWTSVCREDRWKSNTWITPGNIYTQGDYDTAWVEKWADPVGYLVRDLASISLIKKFLDNSNSQWHMFSMCDIVNQFDQTNNAIVQPDNQDAYEKLINLYQDELACIYPSFFRVLWNNKIYDNKLLKDLEKFDGKFSDGHPNIFEHLKYLQIVFPNYQFKETTLEAVKTSNLACDQFIKNQVKDREKDFAIYMLEHDQFKELYEVTKIKPSLVPQKI